MEHRFRARDNTDISVGIRSRAIKKSVGRITNLNRDGAFSELENAHHYPIDSIVEIEFPTTSNKNLSQLRVSAIVVHHDSGDGLGLMFLDENKKYLRWWQSTLKDREAHSALPSCELP